MLESPEVNEYVKRDFPEDKPDILSTIQAWFKNPTAFAIAALIVGMLIGLIFGWVVWPVKWTDASVDLLRSDLQQEWVRMTADSYASGASTETQAVDRLQALGEAASQAISDVQLDFANTAGQTQSALADVLTYYYLQLETDPIDAETPSEATNNNTPVEDPANENDAAAGTSNTTLWFGLSCLVLLIFGGVVAYIYLRKPKEEDDDFSPSLMAQDISMSAEPTDYESGGRDAPISQWVTTYLKGDDLFDDSFSIDTGIGEFMGECGVGIADTIGVGEPKRVSAFEVWLFDKNDIQTVTKVLMSEHLNQDYANRNRLAAKGEPVLLTPGAEVTLETETLQMVVRVMDMSYGQGALPDNSFFEQVSLELSVWKK